MPEMQVLVGDRFGRVIGELTPSIGALSWRLNLIGKSTLSIARTDSKATEKYLRYGNRVLVRFGESLGLPAWGGTIEPPRLWSKSDIQVTLYGIEYTLQFRMTAKGRYFNSEPVGDIFESVLTEAEGKDPMGLVLGQVWRGGAMHFPRYHFKNLWWIIKHSLVKMEGCDVAFTPELANGRISFRAELFEQRGEDKSGRWALKEGKNIGDPRLTEQGAIVNEVAAVGAGSTWGPERPTSIQRDPESVQKYGLRQYSKVFSGVTQATTLDSHAIGLVQENSRPHVRLGLNASNLPPARYVRYDIGDILRCVIPSYGWDGFDAPVRILSREFDPKAVRCRLVVEEHYSAITVYRGPGDDWIGE